MNRFIAQRRGYLTWVRTYLLIIIINYVRFIIAEWEAAVMNGSHFDPWFRFLEEFWLTWSKNSLLMIAIRLLITKSLFDEPKQ